MSDSIDSQLNDWFPQTKLCPPLITQDILLRPHLLDNLGRMAASQRLTLISAPAGYGKTTLLALLSAPGPQPSLPLAWLSLGDEDNDSNRFLLALIAALQQLSSACGAVAQTLLTDPVAVTDTASPTAKVRRVIGVLINEILTELPRPFILALDDLHLISEPIVYLALDYLLERLPPAMHLVIATRYDPPLALARLKARGQLAEIRLTDLRFSNDEAAAFLNERLHLALSPAELANLQDRTEGWAAGLRLLAGSLTRITAPTDRTAFVTSLAKTDRYLFDFLAEEVLARQESHVRMFLLETSILPELTPHLCRAVTGRQDAADILEEIYRRNLFLMSIEDSTGASYSLTYRYHALFAEFLRRRLEREGPERQVGLHRRAAEASLIPGRRVVHYLAAQLWLEAAQAIEAVGEQLLAQGDFDTLRHWITSLPPELVDTRPTLLYLLGVCAWRHWDLDTGRTLLQSALLGFEQNGNLAGQGEALTRLAYIFDLTADFSAGNAAIERALTCPIAPDRRIRLLMNRANHALSQGNWPQTLADIDEALALAERNNTPATLYSLTENLMWGPFSVLPGGLAQMERFYRLLQRQGNTQSLPLQAATCQVLALIYLWRGQWAQAIETIGQAQLLSDQFGNGAWMNANLGAAIPMCYAIQGDTATADRYFADTFQRLNAPDADQFVIAIRAVFYYWLARIRWHQGRLDEMRAVANQLEALSSPQEWPFMPVVRLMLRGLLAIEAGQPRQAEQFLQEAAAIQARLRFTVLFSHADLLLAYLYYRQERLAEALALFTPILADYEARNVPGLMMWEGGRAIVPLLRLAMARQRQPAFAARILALLDESASIEPESEPPPKPALFIPQTGQTLTLRELEILRLLATGASNSEIAQQLIISPHTAKRHIANIFTKMDVSTRTQATLLARDLGFI